jgi:benzodiazapine receptor
MIGNRATFRHAALFAAGVLAASRLAMAGKKGDPRFYDAVKRPSWSPPSWVFGPVWAALSAARLWGDVRLFNSKRRKGALLALEAASWVSFVAFAPAFFRLRSPRLAFASNVAYAATTLASIVLAPRVDAKAALALAPTAAWLGYALPLGGWIAARNADPFLKQEPIARKPFRPAYPSFLRADAHL